MSFWDEFDAFCNLLPKLLLLIGLTLTGTTQTVSHTSTTLPHIQISNKVFGTCTRTFLESSSCFSALNIWQGIAWANYTAVCKRGLSIRSVINVGTQARVSEPDSFSNKTSVGFLSMMKSLRLTGARAGRSPASFPTNTSARHNVRQLVRQMTCCLQTWKSLVQSLLRLNAVLPRSKEDSGTHLSLRIHMQSIVQT